LRDHTAKIPGRIGRGDCARKCSANRARIRGGVEIWRTDAELEFLCDVVREHAVGGRQLVALQYKAPDGTAIGNAKWTGVQLRPLLERARVKQGARFVAMRAADGYHTVLPIDELMREENFLPYLMNGAPLPPDHGYPLRIFIPGKYGMKQPKWITELEFADHEIPGYWEVRGWSDICWRKVNSGFFSPHVEGGLMSIFDHKAKVTSPLDIYGWALAGPSGIKRVEVSPDDGVTWHNAQLVENTSPYVWTVWKYHFAPQAAGDFMMRVRATDGTGIAQPPVDPQTGSGMSGQARIALEVTQV
jgi:hypothetical protein